MIFGAKKQNIFLANSVVLIPKMTLFFFMVIYQFCFIVIAHLWKKDRFTILADRKIYFLKVIEIFR